MLFILGKAHRVCWLLVACIFNDIPLFLFPVALGPTLSVRVMATSVLLSNIDLHLHRLIIICNIRTHAASGACTVVASYLGA
jgi:hypothetical protein